MNQNPARYLKIAAWLRARYTVAGQITTHKGGQPTTYTRRDALAFRRYILTSI
jgi:hypothetical protein